MKNKETHVCEFKKQHGFGKVFIFEISNIEGGEIHVICFTNSTNTLYSKIQLGHVYIISKSIVKLEKKCLTI